MYGFKANILLCSDLMKTEKYIRTFYEAKERIKDAKLADLLLETVPENKRHLDYAIDYPTHELACVQFLITQGFSLKVGPTKEKQYDNMMKLLDFDISFAYLLDAYALGTKTPDVVVHYVPSSRGANNGQRIFLEDEERIIKAKLQQGCDEALRYFCKIASVSGHLLGLDCLNEMEINSIYGKKLKKEAVRLVLNNIIHPYESVM